MDGKIIDLIVPTFNQEDKVEFFLESIASNYIGDKINIIFINDGSTDRTFSLVKNFINVNSVDYVYVYDKDNGGAASARNLGIEVSKSKYIWFCDPDDIILSDVGKVIEQVDKTEPDIFLFSCEVFDSNKENSYALTFPDKFIGRKMLLSDCLRELLSLRLSNNKFNSALIYPWDKIIKKEIVKNNFNESMEVYEDQLFNYNLLTTVKNAVVFFSDLCPYKHIIYKSGTLSTTWGMKKTEDFCFYINCIKNFLGDDVNLLVESEIFYIFKKNYHKSILWLAIYIYRQTGSELKVLSLKSITKMIIYEMRLISLLKAIRSNRE